MYLLCKAFNCGTYRYDLATALGLGYYLGSVIARGKHYSCLSKVTFRIVESKSFVYVRSNFLFHAKPRFTACIITAAGRPEPSSRPREGRHSRLTQERGVCMVAISGER
jgi:hypothetical protein